MRAALDVSGWEKQAAEYCLSEALVCESEVHLLYEHVLEFEQTVTITVDHGGRVQRVEDCGWIHEIGGTTTVRDALYFIAGRREGRTNAHGR